MSQNSESDNRLLNEFMDNYEKNQSNSNQQFSYSNETIKDSFETCSNGTQYNNDQIQSTWSFFQSADEKNYSENGWKSQPF